MNTIIETLSKGKWLLKSHYMNAKIALVLNTMYYQSRTGKVLVIDNKGILEEVMSKVPIRGNPENMILLDKPYNIDTTNIYIGIILVEPEKYPYWIKHGNILVTTTPGNNPGVPRYFKKAVITKYGDEYVLRTSINQYRFKLNGINIIEETLKGILGEAYNTLREAVMEYGELTVKDAVFLLVKELGIDKEKARKILSKLGEKKYIRARKGILELW